MDDFQSQIKEYVDHDNATLQQKKLLLNELRGLVSHPGWMYIQQVLESQANMRYMAIGRSLPTSFDRVIEQAGLRGEAAGMEILRSLPDNLISSLEVDIEASVQPEEKKEEVEDDDYDDDGGVSLG